MNLLYSLFASLALNGVFFIFAAYLRTDVFTDITYRITSYNVCYTKLLRWLPIASPSG